MNKIYKILILGLVLSLLIQTASAVSEGKDYTCVDKEVTKTPPPTPSFAGTKNIEKIPLCSNGKVPKVIDTNQNIDDRDILQDINISTPTAICFDNRCYDRVWSYQNLFNVGVSAMLTQHNPVIDSIKGIHSKTSIETGDFSGNGVQTGWRKTKGDITRLFIAWWKNNVFQCYNGCGWVQTSNFYYPGMPISINNNGVGYIIVRGEYCDEGCGYYNWWIYYNGEPLGYYPDSLWEDNFIGSSYVKYQGEVADYAPVTTTDMGNGLWASNPYAAKIYSQQLWAIADSCPTPTPGPIYCWKNANTVKYATSPNLYSVLETSSNSMRYGGPGSTGDITVTVPNGYENWARGNTKTITWTSSAPGANVKIELLKGGVLNSVISSNTPNDGSYSWYIPVFQPIGSDYKVRITSTTNSAYTDMSNNNFIISSSTPSITVVSPNGGENWRRGTTRTISWSYGGNVGTNVKIELLKGGVLNSVISSSTSNDGSYSWFIPTFQPTGNDYKIRITSTSNSLYKDMSNNNFIVSI